MHTKLIIAISVGLGILFVLVMALVSRLFAHRHAKIDKQDIHTLDGDNGEPYHLPRRSSSWKHLFASKQNNNDAKWVPTLSGIIKAGDEGLWSSALFTNQHGHPGEVSFEAICEMFANELRLRSMTERSAYSGEIGKFLSSTKRGALGPRRVQSVSYKRTKTVRGEAVSPTQRRSLDVSVAERGLGRSLSMKRPAPTVVAMDNGLVGQNSANPAQHTWIKDGQPAEYHVGRMSVRLTSAELAALSIILGSSVSSPTTDAKISDVSGNNGAFGVALSTIVLKGGRHQVNLKQHKRSISQMPCSGSGCSPLFAKHIACGSLPFLQDRKSISSILITEDTLEAIQSGTSLTMRKRLQQTVQSRYLARLPSSHDLIFHAIEPSTKSSPSTPLIDAITMLPFTGGLTPLATVPLIRTIQFITSAGLAPARLLQRLEGLVDKVHRHTPHLNIFGPLHEPQNAGLLFRERERLAKVATGAVTEVLGDKVARMQRYVTMLERLMALVPDTKPQDVLAAVKEATKKELQRSYADAVTTNKILSAAEEPLGVDTHCPQSDARSQRRSRSDLERTSARRSPRTSLGSDGVAGTSTFPEHNLGKQVETLLKSDLPLSVENIATVARLIIVAWTLSVQTVGWEEGEEGFRVPVLEALPEVMILV